MAHEDLNNLLNELLPFAQQCLTKYGEFSPFGAYIDVGGGIAHLSGYTGEEQPKPQELVDLLIAGFRSHAAAGEIRASCICLDMRLIPTGAAEKTDAICARLEHANGEVVEVYLPYRKSPSGEYAYGELFASPGKTEIFQTPKR